jgi:hypothetical protein
MQPKLIDILLASGTGIIHGFFRTRAPLIPYVVYTYLVSTKAKLDQGDQALLKDKERIEADFEKMIQELGDQLPLYKEMVAKPLINLSTPDGTFLGTYLITMIEDPGSGETDGQYVITIDSGRPDIVIQIDTDQLTLGSDLGTCEIYIENCTHLLPFEYN